MNLTEQFNLLEETAKIIESRHPEEWKLFHPRRYVPPNGYPNPKWNSALMAIYMEFMKSEHPNKVEVDSILSTWEILRNLVPTFFVGQEFAESLTQTEPPSNLTIRELQWPFEGMVFVLPEKFQQQYFGTCVPFIRLAITSAGYHAAPPMVRKQYPWAPDFGISEDVYGERAFLVTTTVMYGDKPVDFSGSFSDTDSIETMMNDGRYQDFCIDPVSRDEIEIASASNHSDDLRLLKRTIALAGHLLLAMNAVPEQIEQPKLLRAAKVRNGETLKQELWSPHFLGRQYRWEKESVSQGGHHLSPRLHPRRGHWRHQPFGVGRTQKRIIWIRPMLVGAKQPERTAV